MRGSDKRAVALEYDRTQPGGSPPRVTAKGRHHRALLIETAAREHGVPLVDAPYLAESLYHVDIGDEIPEEFYSLTADILSYVYSLEEMR